MKKSYCMRTIIGLMSVWFLVGCQTQQRNVHDRDREWRVAIVAAANNAGRNFMMDVPEELRYDNIIPEEYWGDEIVRLKPIRVMFDMLNVVIVTQEDWQYEEGYYVSNPISSHAPGAESKYIILEPLTVPQDNAFGILYYYKVRKNYDKSN